MKCFLVLLVICSVIGGLNAAAQGFGNLDDLHQEHIHVDDQNSEDPDEADRSAIINTQLLANGGFRPGAPGVASVAGDLKTSNAFNGRQCYMCTDCPQVFANSTSKWCPYAFDSMKQSRCVVYAEQYKHMRKPWYIRGCASDRGSCDDIRRAHAVHADVVNLLFCEECEGDRCNGVTRSLPDITFSAFVLVVTPILVKFTLL